MVINISFFLKRKLEESHQQLKRKEKEFEETMDHLQKDIDSLEMEKGELKDKLKTLPKKAVMDMKASPMSKIIIFYFYLPRELWS